MDFKEGKCSSCRGILHIPTDRDKIICMYCGEELIVSEVLGNTVSEQEEAKEIPADYERKIEQGMTELPKLLLEIKNPLGSFKKDKYETVFRHTFERYKDTLKAVEEAYFYAPDKESLVSRLAEHFVSEVETVLAGIQKKGAREQKLLDFNMILAVYAIPVIVEYKGKSSDPLADAILDEWKRRFPKTNVGKSDYERIQGGFRKKLCYITTAVCETLGKGDDCYELTLLRNYRDTFLMAQEDGEAVICEYYNIAPTIVTRINKLANAKEVYKGVWDKYLSACIHLIEENKNSECKKIYYKMVRDLQQEYCY